MDSDLALMLGRELNRLSPELMMKHMKATIAGDEERCHLAVAQMAMHVHMMELYQEDDDYYLFVKQMDLVRQAQEAFYRESRAANDRKLSLIALSRLRLLGMLRRRLTAGEREQTMEILRTNPSIPFH